MLAAAAKHPRRRWRRRKRPRCAPRPRIPQPARNLDFARQPLAEAERRAQRLDTEAKTLARLLHVDTKNLWPAVIDELTVEKGYEAALGAALGDDLDAPDRCVSADALGGCGSRSLRSAPARRCRGARRSRQGAAGAGAAARTDRRDRARGRRSPRRADQARPAPGLARWRSLALGRILGCRQCADRSSPPAGRQEPPCRHRGGAGNRATRGREQAAGRSTRAQAEVASTAGAETAARNRWRSLQHAADSARDRHAEAEREAGRNAARLSALGEAMTRLSASRDEASCGPRRRGTRARGPSADRRARGRSRFGAGRDRSEASAPRRGPRGRTGAGTRIGDLRPSSRRHRRRSSCLDRTQQQCRLADRDARSPRRRSEAPSVRASKTPRGCSRSNGAD